VAKIPNVDGFETWYLVIFEVADFKFDIKRKIKNGGFEIEISVLYSESVTKLTNLFSSHIISSTTFPVSAKYS